MGRIYESIDEMVGHTPLLRLHNIEKENELNAKLYAKLECFNPGGSAKDRVAKKMLDDALREGKIGENAVIIEPTSGNTGVGLAAIGSARGYRVIIVLPDSMSKERMQLIKSYGAELVLTPGSEGMSGAIRKAEELSKEIPGSFIPGQFVNKSNPDAHYTSTGPEIWDDTDGKIDMFVAGVGTGGTITGTGRYLKEMNPAVQVVGIEPFTSAVLSGEPAGKHDLQGIGAGFIPQILDVKLIDEIYKVKDEEAYAAGRQMAAKEGMLVGITSGASLHAAIQIAKRPENAGKNIVVLMTDTGERYLSTKLFSE